MTKPNTISSKEMPAIRKTSGFNRNTARITEPLECLEKAAAVSNQNHQSSMRVEYRRLTLVGNQNAFPKHIS